MKINFTFLKDTETEERRGNEITDRRFFRVARIDRGHWIPIHKSRGNTESTFGTGEKFDLSGRVIPNPVQEKWNVGRAVVSNLSSSDILHSLWK